MMVSDSMDADAIPKTGCLVSPIRDSDIGRLPDMGDARHIVAANLMRLMAESEDLTTIKGLSERCGVSTGTIDRTRRAESAIGVDNLESVAAAFGLQAWQMLIPGIKAGADHGTRPDAVSAAVDLLRYARSLEQKSASNVVRLEPGEPDSGLKKGANQKRRGQPARRGSK
jgi:hypothetical protein